MLIKITVFYKQFQHLKKNFILEIEQVGTYYKMFQASYQAMNLREIEYNNSLYCYYIYIRISLYIMSMTKIYNII